MIKPTPNLSSFSDMLKLGLGSLVDQDADGFLSMMAEGAVMEFPFAPAGFPRQVRGRADLAAYLGRFGELLEISTISAPQVHRTADPEVVILQFSATGRGVKTGTPYNQAYISVITARNGHIVRYQDYWNPLVVTETLGGADAWASGAAGQDA